MQVTRALRRYRQRSKRHSLQAVEQSQQTQAAVQIVSNLPDPRNGARFTVFWACGPAGWLSLLLTKAGDVETNPGPTTLNKKVWIYDICHKQMHVRKQISIRCNRIEHWVHLRCAGIRQAQYTYLDLPSTQRIQTHTSYRHNTTLPLPTLVQPPYPLPTHTTATKTQTHVQHSPSPPAPPRPKHIHMSHTPPTPLTSTSKHPKYITSQQCAPIGWTRQEVGSLHSLETTSHSLQQTYLRLLIHTTQNFKWSRYTFVIFSLYIL